MEGYEELSSLKPQTTDEEHLQHHQQQQELGLGFQSSPPCDPKPNPNFNPSPTDDNLIQIVTQELQNLALKEGVHEDVRILASKQATDEERDWKHAIAEELYHLALKTAIDEERAAKQGLCEDLHNQVLRYEEEVKAESKNEPKNNPVLEENEVNERNSGHEEVKDEVGIDRRENNRSENENEEVNGWDEVKEVDGIDNYEHNRRENEEEDDYNVNENVGGELGAGAVAGSNGGEYMRHHHPLRSDAEDCSYYMRTGMCKFGSSCKFNHSLRRKNQAAKETVKQNEEISERPGPTECKYYPTSGGCKFGKSCRYNHSRGKTAVAPILEFNFLGLPIRMGEKECPYFMRTGSCKYGSNCRFNHPDPTTVGGADTPPRHGNGGSFSLQGASKTTMSSWSSPRTLNENAPFVPRMHSPTQGVTSPNPEWNGYQAPVYPTSEAGLPTPPAFAMKHPASDTNFYRHDQQQMLVEEFPERPGQPECSYFLKTGDCKYRSGCKFHHPKSWIPKTHQCVLSDRGLPLRPDQNICTHYSRHGICKFGPGCKYDHPIEYDNSASSEPDLPLPFGNSATAGGARMAGSANGRESLIQQHW